MISKNVILKILGAIVFIAGGMIGGSINVKGTLFSKLPFILSMFIALIVMYIGIAIWKSSKETETEDEVNDENRKR